MTEHAAATPPHSPGRVYRVSCIPHGREYLLAAFLMLAFPLSAPAAPYDPERPHAIRGGGAIKEALPIVMSRPRRRFDGEIRMHDGNTMLVGGDSQYPTDEVEVIDVAQKRVYQIAPVPALLLTADGLELKDHSILVFGGLRKLCGSGTGTRCDMLEIEPSYRYLPEKKSWQPLPRLSIAYTSGIRWSNKIHDRLPRNDALVRNNGNFVWIDGGEIINYEPKTTVTSELRSWQTDGKESRLVARLNRGRANASLIELADGRIAVMGGHAQFEESIKQIQCWQCPLAPEFSGPYPPARSTEILDESGQKPVWRDGPTAYFGGGQALKLANGRIFKLSMVGQFEPTGYSAEIADAAFTHWEQIPPFPAKQVIVRNTGVAGNRVLVLLDNGDTIVWDDEARDWRVWQDWPPVAANENNPARSVTALPGNKKVLVRYIRSFDIVEMP